MTVQYVVSSVAMRSRLSELLTSSLAAALATKSAARLPIQCSMVSLLSAVAAERERCARVFLTLGGVP
jgi:hypothetical protein